MADEKALAPRPASGIKPHREAELRSIVQRVIMRDVRNVNLQRYMFQSDEELDKAYLTPAQKAKVRQWEMPKKLISAGLLSAHDRLMAFIRQQDQQKSVSLHVEAVIRLPEKRESEGEPVIIDVEPSK